MRQMTLRTYGRMPAREAARQQVLAAVRAHLHGGVGAPLYLTTRRTSTATAILGATAAELRAAGWNKRLLVCTGRDFVALWRDTLRRGLTPFVRRALDAKWAIVLDGLEALRDEPVAQWELARLIVPGRLIVVSGHGHLYHVAAWSPVLRARFTNAVGLCLHAGPCITDADAWALIDRVAGYYGLTRGQLLSRRRTAHIVLARQMGMHLLRAEGLTASHIGRLLRRDHATVLHGDARIRHRAAGQSNLQYDLDTLRRMIAA